MTLKYPKLTILAINGVTFCHYIVFSQFRDEIPTDPFYMLRYVYFIVLDFARRCLRAYFRSIKKK